MLIGAIKERDGQKNNWKKQDKNILAIIQRRKETDRNGGFHYDKKKIAIEKIFLKLLPIFCIL